LLSPGTSCPEVNNNNKKTEKQGAFERQWGGPAAYQVGTCKSPRMTEWQDSLAPLLGALRMSAEPQSPP
jgi:hypothetical protein